MQRNLEERRATMLAERAKARQDMQEQQLVEEESEDYRDDTPPVPEEPPEDIQY